MKDLREEVEQLQALKLGRELHVTLRLGAGVSEIRGRRVIDFTNWDFLGLATNSRVKRTAQATIEQSGLGVSSSRLSSGTSDEHVNCEGRLSKFFRTESALLFSSRNQALFTLVASLLGERDAIFFDELTTAPVGDAAYLVHAQVHNFKSDDVSSLEIELEKARFARRKVIYVETLSPISSREPDMAKLVLMALKHNAELLVDESFALGTIGIRGAGRSEELVAKDGILAVIADLSLGAACFGAAVASPSLLREFLVLRSRMLANECAIPSSFAAAICTSLDTLELQTLERSSVLQRARRLRDGLIEIGLARAQQFDSPIVAINFEKRSIAADFAAAIFQRGFMADVVPRGTSLSESFVVRFLVTLAHTDQQIDSLLQAVLDIRARVVK